MLPNKNSELFTLCQRGAGSWGCHSPIVEVTRHNAGAIRAPTAFTWHLRYSKPKGCRQGITFLESSLWYFPVIPITFHTHSELSHLFLSKLHVGCSGSKLFLRPRYLCIISCTSLVNSLCPVRIWKTLDCKLVLRLQCALTENTVCL
jgi:hypothetical protein